MRYGWRDQMSTIYVLAFESECTQQHKKDNGVLGCFSSREKAQEWIEHRISTSLEWHSYITCIRGKHTEKIRGSFPPGLSWDMEINTIYTIAEFQVDAPTS